MGIYLVFLMFSFLKKLCNYGVEFLFMLMMFICGDFSMVI